MIDQQTTIVLEKRVQLILSQCKAGDGLYSFSLGELSAHHVTINFSDEDRVESLESLQFYRANNEHIELLRSLYQAQDADGRQVVVSASRRSLISPNCAAQVFVFLARYHSFRDTLQFLTADSTFLWIAEPILPALAQVLRFDHAFISNDDLDVLYPELNKTLKPLMPKGTVETRPSGRRVTNYSPEESRLLDLFVKIRKLVNYIGAQTQRIQYFRLRKELREGANFEINQDRERLLDSLSLLGFSSQLTEFLKFAEVEFTKAQDAFSYKTSVDQIRSFFAELLNETAAKIAAIRGETLISAKVDTKYPVEVRTYLEKTGFFSEQFRTLVDGLYKFMSDEGTHTIGSTKDVARIARNIAIEIGLLITKRLQLKVSPTP